MDNKTPDPESPQLLTRSITSMLVTSMATGAAGGVAGAVTTQALSKLPKKPKK